MTPSEQQELDALRVEVQYWRAKAAASEFGKLGGQARSAAKTAAVRANAKRPRPNARGKKKPRKPKAGDAVLERDQQKAGIA